MLHDRLSVFSHETVHDVEEIVSLWKPVFSHLVRKVQHEVCIVLHVRPKINDRKFIVHGHVYAFDVFERHKFLVPSKDLLQEVLVDPSTNSLA